MPTILWQDVETGALDRCRMETGPDGLRLAGIVLTPAHGTPLDVHYLVEAGPDGRTRRVELELDGGATHRALLADGAGHWRWEDGPGLPEVDGAAGAGRAVRVDPVHQPRSISVTRKASSRD